MAVKVDLTPITDEELLLMVKQLNDYGDLTEDDVKLQLRIDGAKIHLLSCGVPEAVVNSRAAVEVIASYVDDLNRGKPLSEFVNQKVAQLRMCSYE